MNARSISFYIALCISLFAFSSGLLAQEPDLSKINLKEFVPINPAVKLIALPNGFKYFLSRNESKPNRIFIKLNVKADDFRERADFDTHHVLEHVLLKSCTLSSENLSFGDYLAGSGATFNAGPGEYYFEISNDTTLINNIFLTLSGWLSGRCPMASEVIEGEKRVVLSEAIYRNASSVSFDLQSRLLDPSRYSSAYRNFDLIANIPKLPVGLVRQFYHAWYNPNFAALSVVGDFDVTRMEQTISQAFGMPKTFSETVRVTDSIPLSGANKYLAILKQSADSATTTIQMYFLRNRSPKIRYQDFRDDVLIEIFNAMITNRMVDHQTIVGPQDSGRLEIKFETDPLWFPHGVSFLRLSVVSSISTIESRLKKILTECERIRRYGFEEKELENARVILRSENEGPVISMEKEAEIYSRKFCFGDAAPSPTFSYNLRQKFLNEITKEEINDRVRQWIIDKNKIIVIQGSESIKKYLPKRSIVDRLLKQIREADTLARYKVPPEAKEPLIVLKFDSSRLCPRTCAYTRADFPNIGVTRLYLCNGANVVIKSSTSVDGNRMFLKGLRRSVGFMFNKSRPSIRSRILELAGNRGIFNLNKAQLDLYKKQQDIRGAVIIDDAGLVVSVSAPNGKEEQMLQLLCGYFSDLQNDSTAYHASSARLSAGDRNEDIGDLTYKEAREMYSGLFSSAGDFTFIISGAQDINKIIVLITKYLGAWQIRENGLLTAESMGISDEAVTQSKTVINKKLNKYESLVKLRYGGPYFPSNRENAKLGIMAYVIESVLFRRLREKEGGIYAVNCDVRLRASERLYEIKMEFKCSPEIREKLIDAVQNEIVNLHERGPTETDFIIARRKYKEPRILSKWDDWAWSYWLNEQYKNGGDFNDLFDMEMVIDSVTQSDIQKAAKDYLKPDRFVAYSEIPEGN
jgi:zinc protease